MKRIENMYIKLPYTDILNQCKTFDLTPTPLQKKTPLKLLYLVVSNGFIIVSAPTVTLVFSTERLQLQPLDKELNCILT